MPGSCFIDNVQQFFCLVQKKALNDCAKDMNVSELRGSAPLHPVRCPVVIFIKTKRFNYYC